MSENPLQLLFKTYEKVSNSIQTQLAQFIGVVPNVHSSHNNNDNDQHSLSLLSSSSSSKNQLASAMLLQHSELPKKVFLKGLQYFFFFNFVVWDCGFSVIVEVCS